MLRLIRLILVVAVFLGGYYLGRLPDSPDIFGAAADVYGRMADSAGPSAPARDPDRSAGRPAGRPVLPDTAAYRDDPSLVDAAMAYLRDKAPAPQREAAGQEDLWGYRRPTPRNRR